MTIETLSHTYHNVVITHANDTWIYFWTERGEFRAVKFDTVVGVIM
jgi:hypothetical protein